MKALNDLRMNRHNYLHFYLGCDCLVFPSVDVDTELALQKLKPRKMTLELLIQFRNELNRIKPILRNLSDRTWEERRDANNIERSVDYGFKAYNRYADLTDYLRSRHFDLSGLIEGGLAIDKNKMIEYGK